MIKPGSRLIELVNVSKVFDGDTAALRNINLYIRNGEFITLLGPSGCGKTTTLRIIAGFEQPTSGQIFMDGSEISTVPPYRRRVNTIFQRYALFPHLNVFENVAFGLRVKKKDEPSIRKKVTQMLELVDLAGYGKRHVDNLSGGQQQRVAIARALANEPEVLLLDEPLGALDLKMRKEMQVELKRIQQEMSLTFVYVTHDQEEALTMSDTVVVMNHGQIQQVGTPIDIYNEPKNALVADFIGESNIVRAVMTHDEEVVFLGHTFACVDRGFSPDEQVEVVVRPEDFKLVDEAQGAIRGVVQSIIFKGVHYEMMINCGDFIAMVHNTQPRTPGDPVGLTVRPEDIHVMRIQPPSPGEGALDED